jgi:hypothetical protein
MYRLGLQVFCVVKDNGLRRIRKQEIAKRAALANFLEGGVCGGYTDDGTRNTIES